MHSRLEAGDELTDERAEQVADRRRSFEIFRPDPESEFWHYFTNDSIHSFLEQGCEEEAAASATSHWLE